METKKVLLYIKENIRVHKQNYLDRDAVEFYWLLEKLYEPKELRKSLVKEYGVTEVEAINILNQQRTNIADYLVRYQRMQVCDERKKYLLKYLLNLELPEFIQDKQIENLNNCFIYGKYDRELLNVVVEDRDLRAHDFVYELLNE